MWIMRDVEPVVNRMAGQFPAVLVTGARQTGKTSLLRHLFPRASYITLDLPAYAEAATTAPDSLLNKYPEPLIIDEIQYAPALLKHLKVRIDRNRTPGRFLLTGSQGFKLMEGVSESLAGRCGILELLTLSYGELQVAGYSSDEASYIFLGGYPELYVGADWELWFPSYVATYLERDVRNISQVIDLQDFNRFLRVCALRNAQVVNYTDMARDTGIAPNTARKWAGLLVASGVLYLLEPYFGNRIKRIIKSPKLFFLDSGLASFLAGFRSSQELMDSSFAGAFWEGYVFGQIKRFYANRGMRVPLYYWRTVNGQEVDIVIELSSGSIFAIEAKWKEHPALDDAAGLRALETACGKKIKVMKIIVARTEVKYQLRDGSWVMGLKDLLESLDAS
jgi:predicted AAA+ superfamily ATPase